MWNANPDEGPTQVYGQLRWKTLHPSRSYTWVSIVPELASLLTIVKNTVSTLAPLCGAPRDWYKKLSPTWICPTNLISQNSSFPVLLVGVLNLKMKRSSKNPNNTTVHAIPCILFSFSRFRVHLTTWHSNALCIFKFGVLWGRVTHLIGTILNATGAVHFSPKCGGRL